MEEKTLCIDCIDYPICALHGICADDAPCIDYKSNTDPEEPGND